MRKLFKMLCIVGVSLLLAGGLVFGVGMIVAKGDISALSHLKSKGYSYEETAENPIESVYVDYDSLADIRVEFSETAENVGVEYAGLQTKKNKPASKLSFSDSNGELRIVERTKFVGNFNGFFGSVELKVKITLPTTRAFALVLKTDTGNVRLTGNGNLTALKLSCDTGDISTDNAVLNCSGGMELETDTGDIKLGQFTAKTCKIDVDTGDVRLKNGTVGEKITIGADTGDVEVAGVLQAEEIAIETDTGDFNMKKGLLNASVIRLQADTGDINAKLAGAKSDYAIYVSKDTGKSNVNSQEGGDRKLFVETDAGDIRVTFER